MCDRLRPVSELVDAGIERYSTVEVVHSRVRAAILAGQLEQGSQLGEAALATTLGVSRSPLREALSRLEQEGLVERLPYRGAFVKRVTPGTIEEITSLRMVLEEWAIAQGRDWLCTEGAVEAASLLNRLRESARTDDWPECIDSHLALHRLVYESTKNATLIAIWGGWETQLRLYISTRPQSETTSDVLASCELLWEAILSGSQERIHRELVSHCIGKN